MIIDQSNWFWYAAALLLLVFFTVKLVLAYARYSQSVENTRWQKEREKELHDENLRRLTERDNELQRQLDERRKKLDNDLDLRVQAQVKGWKLRFEDELKKAALDWARNELNKWMLAKEKDIRRSAALQSQATIIGLVSENIAPFLPGFNFNPKDARFIGNPIDFIVFDGADQNELRAVVFVEVKSGNGKLSDKQRKIKQAVEEGRVLWKTLHIGKQDSAETRPSEASDQEAETLDNIISDEKPSAEHEAVVRNDYGNEDLLQGLARLYISSGSRAEEVGLTDDAVLESLTMRELILDTPYDLPESVQQAILEHQSSVVDEEP